MPETVEELRHKVAVSNKILAMMGMVKITWGHVSARIPGTNEMFIRCRGPQDTGMSFVSDEDIRRGPFDTQPMTDLGDGWRAPGELAIHGESFRMRPEVNCVIHAHPPGALMIGLGNVPLRPILGSYDGGISLKMLKQEGYATFPHSHLIDRPELAHRMMAAMGNRHAIILRGHGVTITGTSVEEATVRAIIFEALCRITWQLRVAGVEAPEVSNETVEEYVPNWAKSFFAARQDEGMWRHWEELLETAPALPFLVGLDHVMI